MSSSLHVATEKTAMWELGKLIEREVSTGRRGGDFF
jgi:hypothetical protein